MPCQFKHKGAAGREVHIQLRERNLFGRGKKLKHILSTIIKHTSVHTPHTLYIHVYTRQERRRENTRGRLPTKLSAPTPRQIPPQGSPVSKGYRRSKAEYSKGTHLALGFVHPNESSEQKWLCNSSLSSASDYRLLILRSLQRATTSNTDTEKKEKKEKEKGGKEERKRKKGPRCYVGIE